MASALHIKDSFAAILINLGNTSRRTTHFDEGSSVFPTLPLPRKGRSSIEAGSSRSLEKGSVVNSDPLEALWRSSALASSRESSRKDGSGAWLLVGWGIINDVFCLYAIGTEVGVDLNFIWFFWGKKEG